MYSIGQGIQAYYIQSTPWGSASGAMQVYVPSLLTASSMGKPKATPISLDKSCFNNASDCTPTVASTISSQNYVTAQPSYTPYENSYYGYGSGIKVVAENSDLLSCRLSKDLEDNSFNL